MVATLIRFRILRGGVRARRAMLALTLGMCGACGNSPEPVTPVSFEDVTANAGLQRYSQTFAAVASDIDGDGTDDLLISNHGKPPALFLQRAGQFIEASELLQITDHRDRHGFTVVDLDNDGDRDFVYAGGGADGIGAGKANAVYRNLLRESGELAFENASGESSIDFPEWRSRVFLPLANPAGNAVDLYLTSLHKNREGSTNLYIRNSSEPGKILLALDTTSSLNLRLESDGKDLFFDYDRDGDVDFLRIGQARASLYRNDAGQYTLLPSEIDSARRVISAAVADLNNDGYPDLYLGAASGHTLSDNIAANDEEIHFAVRGQAGDTSDSITFRSSERAIRINFLEHMPGVGANRTDASDIFIGATMANPKRRTSRIGRRQAEGRPADFAQSGAYIWFDFTDKLWHLHFENKGNEAANAMGIVYGKNLELVARTGLETFPTPEVADYIYINQQGKGWRPLKSPVLKHDAWTNYLSAADFNNDGSIDIAGVRTYDDAKANGTPFILLNNAGKEFSVVEPLSSVSDDIYRADIIVHGMFNPDGLPDLFITNGFGLLPANKGPYALWLNRTATGNGHLLLELEGSTANRDAIGAQVEVYSADDRLLGYRELGPGYGRGQDTHKLHFGLGAVPGPYRLEIRWPGASSTQSLVLEDGGLHRIRQP